MASVLRYIVAEKVSQIPKVPNLLIQNVSATSALCDSEFKLKNLMQLSS